MNDLSKNKADSGAINQGPTPRKIRLGAVKFADIRQKGSYYADKTEFLYQIAIDPDPFFLSRPRRFGKTLLVSTLQCLLEGRRELFKGLWIDQSDYHWTPCPVIRLEMNLLDNQDISTMKISLTNMLIIEAMLLGIELKETLPGDMLTNLISRLYLKSGQAVAVLIDEYDAPIVEHLTDPDKADEFRAYLREFYGVLKTGK
ncbi:MAG: AAA family ATPase, partial [Deltaproteobacteria bacterium]|nr:AAA family ATPase [Deltaproteobacteria bacterium]